MGQFALHADNMIAILNMLVHGIRLQLVVDSDVNVESKKGVLIAARVRVAAKFFGPCLPSDSLGKRANFNDISTLVGGRPIYKSARHLICQPLKRPRPNMSSASNESRAGCPIGYQVRSPSGRSVGYAY